MLLSWSWSRKPTIRDPNWSTICAGTGYYVVRNCVSACVCVYFGRLRVPVATRRNDWLHKWNLPWVISCTNISFHYACITENDFSALYWRTICANWKCVGNGISNLAKNWQQLRDVAVGVEYGTKGVCRTHCQRKVWRENDCVNTAMSKLIYISPEIGLDETGARW